MVATFNFESVVARRGEKIFKQMQVGQVGQRRYW